MEEMYKCECGKKVFDYRNGDGSINVCEPDMEYFHTHTCKYYEKGILRVLE